MHELIKEIEQFNKETEINFIHQKIYQNLFLFRLGNY